MFNINLKCYSWENLYNRELANHVANPTDEGSIWFEDSAAEEKMIEFLDRLELDGRKSSVSISDDETVRILDVGTGNGHLLFAMREDGWQSDMVGVDYSARSIDLAQQIQLKRNEDGELRQSVHFAQFDILKDRPGTWLKQGFDIILDKGTFDAISLNSEQDADGRRAVESYASKLTTLVRIGGVFLIISCNWTEDELRAWFRTPQLKHRATLHFPSYTFGGVKGQTVSGVCFERVRSM